MLPLLLHYRHRQRAERRTKQCAGLGAGGWGVVESSWDEAATVKSKY
jgi:hypothetical protein